MKDKLKEMDKKKLYLVIGFFVAIIIILFGGAFVYNKFFYKRSYVEIEEIMVNASKNYLAKNKNRFPKNYNDVVTLSDSDLVGAEEMKTISEYLKDETSTCSGNVTVTNINGQYRYVPVLDCGNKYKTVTFIDYIKKMVPIKESGTGLYQLNDELVYRGDSPNNYIKFSGKTYRIVKFSGDSAVIIYTEQSEPVPWDDRYNIEEDMQIGINDYSVSRIKDTADAFYKDTQIITSNNKLLVIAHNLEVGKRATEDTDKTGGLEKSAIIENQFVGFLPLYDYLNASLDSNCNKAISESCINYNYLSKFMYSWWTMTASNQNTYSVYKISGSGSGLLANAETDAYYRPVLYLSKDALYVSGDGSSENPYIVK